MSTNNLFNFLYTQKEFVSNTEKETQNFTYVK